MPTPTSYDYAVTAFPNDAVDVPSLRAEIEAHASISIALDGAPIITLVAQVATCRISFKDDLETQSPDEKPFLDAVVAAHQGVTTVTTETVSIGNAPDVQIRKPDGLTHGRVYAFSVNFCDKTTWYHDALEVADEAVGVGDGVVLTFPLGHGTNVDPGERIADCSHGKISEENNIATPAGNYRDMGNGYGTTLTADLSGYVPIVKVDGIEQTERAYADATGGDYEIDYVTGDVIFYTAPANTLAITATYYYVQATDRAHVVVIPAAGKRNMIDRVEIQSTPDACQNADLVMNVYAGAAHPNGGAIARPTVIKNVTDIVNWAYGARPQIPVQGGANPRALALPVNIHQVRYTSEIPLLSSMLMYMEVHSATAEEFDGTWASIVIYGIEEDE